MAYQQYIAQLKTSIEIEPQNCIASTDAAPCSFYIDDYTIGFVQSRYIGFYCQPLMLYKYVALPLIIKRVVAVHCFQDGLFFALFSETQKNQQLLTVYQTATQRILSNITLAEEWVHPPTSFQFGVNSSVIHLTYLEPRPRIVTIAWQRGQADDLLQLPEDAKIVSINPYTQSTIISCNSHQIVRFWRRCDEEIHSFNPTRLKQAFARKFRNIDIYFIDFFWLTSEIVVGIMNIGELFIFMVPKFIGFVGVSLVNDDRKVDKMFGDKPQISDILTTVAKFQNRICYGTKSGDVVLIEIDTDLLKTAQILKQNNQASLSKNTKQQLKLFDSIVDDDPNTLLNNDLIFELLPSDSCKAYNGSKCNVYPHKFLAQSNVGQRIAIRDIQLGPKYAIIQTQDNALYVWNHSAPSVFYDTTLKTINISDPIKLIQQQNTSGAVNLDAQQQKDIATVLQGRPLVQDSMKDIYNSIFTAESDIKINEQLKSIQSDQQIEATTVTFTNTLVTAYRAVDIDKQYVDNFDFDVNIDSISSIQEIQLLMSQCLLNFQTNYNTWSDIILGLPKCNFNLTPMKQTIYGSRYSIAKNSLMPVGFKYGNKINIQRITHFDENEICNLLSITTADNAILFLTIDTLDVIAQFNFNFEIQCVQIHPSGVIAYCQYLSGIGSFLINDGMIQIMQHKSFQNIRTFKISNGGGLLAIVSDINQRPEILIVSSSDFTILSKIQCHCEKIVYFDFIPGDTIFVSISRDGRCFGHTIYNGERVFDCNIRNVNIKQAFCILGRQLDGDTLMEDIQIAKDVGFTNLNVESNYYRKDFEKFVICAIDNENKYHEIADGIQLHEIQLQQNQICSVCLVPAPPSYWSLRYQKLFVQQNMTDTNSSHGLFDQSALLEHQLQDDNSCRQKDIIKRVDNQYFNEQTVYNKLISETSGSVAEQFSEKTLKFILIGNENGIVSAYEYPLRDNIEIFSIKLHDEPILSLKIVNGSQLITVSKNQLLISNIRFLLPSEAVFGVLVKNRLTNKLKQLKDQSDNQLLMKMPITRFYPALTYYKSSRTIEAIETVNKLLLQTVFNIAEQNNSVEIRLQNIHESFQNKNKIISKEIDIMQQKFNDYINPFQMRLSELKNIIQVMDQQFKTTLQQEYLVAQAKFGNKINDVRQDNLLLKDRIERQRQDTKTILQGESVQRKLQLDSVKQQRKMHIQAKEAEIVMIDENLDLQEKQKDEELKQIAEERQIIIAQLKIHGQLTINRQNDALQALQSWKQLQDRRQQQIKKANDTLIKQLRLGENTLSQCISDQNDIQNQLDAMMVQLQVTNHNVSKNEEVISQLKRDIHQQGKSHFVMSHQIGELKDEIRPRDDLISDMKDRTQQLTQKLDKVNGQWGTTQETIVKAQQEITFLSNKYNQLINHFGSRNRIFDSIKKQFSNCMADKVQNQWFVTIVKMSEQYRELTKELSMISKQREKDGFIISPDVIDEIDVHNDYLHEKLQNLYDNLHIEDQKFVNIQSYSLDENSAMLIESHKLKDDNLELTAQYQKVMAMIQALQVQQVTQDMLSNEQNLKRTQSQANTFRSLIDKQHGSARPVSQIGNQLEREKTLIRGITSAIHSARSINTMSASSMRGRSAITNSAVSRGGPRPPLSGKGSKKEF